MQRAKNDRSVLRALPVYNALFHIYPFQNMLIIVYQSQVVSAK